MELGSLSPGFGFGHHAHPTGLREASYTVL